MTNRMKMSIYFRKMSYNLPKCGKLYDFTSAKPLSSKLLKSVIKTYLK